MAVVLIRQAFEFEIGAKSQMRVGDVVVVIVVNCSGDDVFVQLTLNVPIAALREWMRC